MEVVLSQWMAKTSAMLSTYCTQLLKACPEAQVLLECQQAVLQAIAAWGGDSPALSEANGCHLGGTKAPRGVTAAAAVKAGMAGGGRSPTKAARDGKEAGLQVQQQQQRGDSGQDQGVGGRSWSATAAAVLGRQIDVWQVGCGQGRRGKGDRCSVQARVLWGADHLGKQVMWRSPLLCYAMLWLWPSVGSDCLVCCYLHQSIVMVHLGAFHCPLPSTC
jgi:hypothetical protein